MDDATSFQDLYAQKLQNVQASTESQFLRLLASSERPPHLYSCCVLLLCFGCVLCMGFTSLPSTTRSPTAPHPLHSSRRPSRSKT